MTRPRLARVVAAAVVLFLWLAGREARNEEVRAHARAGADTSAVHDTHAVDTTMDGQAERVASTTRTAEFDLDGDGVAEHFRWWWDLKAEQMRVVVSKGSGAAGRELLRTAAPTTGWCTEAWFLDESPVRKAVFMTCNGGSSGNGLFHLDMRAKKLRLFTGKVYLEDEPHFEDLEGDGQREIFVRGRGRDRTSAWGAALYRWNGAGYTLWWPNWSGVPYPIYGVLADLNSDGHAEIIAVLETERYSDEAGLDRRLSGARALGVWSVRGGELKCVAKVDLPNATWISEPEIAGVSRVDGEEQIELAYDGRRVACTYRNGELHCPTVDEK